MLSSVFFSLNYCENGDEKWHPRRVLHQLLHSSFNFCLLLVTEKRRLKTNNTNTQHNDNTFDFIDKKNELSEYNTLASKVIASLT